MPVTDERLLRLRDNFNREEVKRIRTNPARFRDILNIVRADGETLPFRPDPWQRRDLEHMDSAFMRMAGFDAQPQHRLAWYERPRSHSKTTDMACMAAYSLYASPRKLSCYAAASDKDQATLLRDGIDTLVRANPFLSSYLEVQEHRVVNVCTGSTMQIMSSHVGSSLGINPDMILVDEITVWDEGRGELLWESLHTAIGKKPNSVMVVITNAGTKRSWQFPIREAIRNNKEWYFSHLPGIHASWLSKEFIESQREICRSQARFNRLWQNEWIASDESDALSYADIQAALPAVGEARGPARERENGWVYLAGLDLGISRDATALATIAVDVGWIEEVPRQGKEQEQGRGGSRRGESNAMRIMREQAYADGDFYNEEPGAVGTDGEGDAAALPPQDYVTRGGTGRVKLVDVEVWQPTGKGDRVQLEGVKQAILKLDERFGLSGIAADNYQAEMLSTPAASVKWFWEIG